MEKLRYAIAGMVQQPEQFLNISKHYSVLQRAQRSGVGRGVTFTTTTTCTCARICVQVLRRLNISRHPLHGGEGV